VVDQKFTGKERDAESGLDYFGARYYGSALGRFTSPDPSKLSVLPAFPQTWNRYSYVYNNPLALKDSDGKWPTSIHNDIIDKAFPNLSPAQRQILKNVSANQDGVLNGGQSKGLSFEHAMREPGQSVADAQAKYNDFVQGNEDAANNLQIYMSDPDTEFTTLTPDALEAFGRALHAIEDSLSPAHSGFQVWDYNAIHIAQHHFNENSINPQQMRNAVNAARSAFNSTFRFFNFNMPLDGDVTTHVTTIQGSGQPCGGSTGVPCPK
jgi:RHS repeat-associated protein